MTQQLTLELPDDLYEEVKRAAHANAQTLNEWLLSHLPDLLPTSFFHVLPRDSDAELKLALSVAES